MPNKNLINSLISILSDSYALYLKTQNYHWNVEGPQFLEIHKLLEKHYEDLANAIDEIAEIIRSLGEKTPGNWKIYEKFTKIQNGDEQADARTMLIHLSKDQEIIIKTLTDGISKAQELADETTAGFLTERVAIHRKNHWMLKSMLK